jgi:hypothetical protein
MVIYPSAIHGSRYVNNYANAVAAESCARCERVETIRAGSVLAEDSFVVNPNGRVAVGPLFLMERLASGAGADTHDWRYPTIMSNGSRFAVTGGKNSANVKFCAECHATLADDQDGPFVVPEALRAGFP